MIVHYVELLWKYSILKYTAQSKLPAYVPPHALHMRQLFSLPGADLIDLVLTLTDVMIDVVEGALDAVHQHGNGLTLHGLVLVEDASPPRLTLQQHVTNATH